MSATTLVIIDAPTMADGMGELLAISTALAIGDAIGMGVTVWRDPEGWLIDAEPDPEVAPGVIITDTYRAVDPWADDLGTDWRASEARQLLEALHATTTGDILATADGVRWLDDTTCLGPLAAGTVIGRVDARRG